MFLRQNIVSVFKDKQFLNYLVVGVFNTLFGYFVFACLIYLGLHYSFALLIATVLGVLFNFKTLGRFVFNRTEITFIWKFIGVYGFLYGVNVLCVFCFMMYVHNVYLANALTLGIIALLGFYLNRRFVYANH